MRPGVSVKNKDQEATRYGPHQEQRNVKASEGREENGSGAMEESISSIDIKGLKFLKITSGVSVKLMKVCFWRGLSLC